MAIGDSNPQTQGRLADLVQRLVSLEVAHLGALVAALQAAPRVRPLSLPLQQREKHTAAWVAHARCAGTRSPGVHPQLLLRFGCSPRCLCTASLAPCSFAHWGAPTHAAGALLALPRPGCTCAVRP